MIFNIDFQFCSYFRMVTPSQRRAFVHFENSPLPRIWKVSVSVFTFNILFRFILNKMMVTEVKVTEDSFIIHKLEYY